jgi:hypothetical protein
MTQHDLDMIANENGGGLSHSVTGKYTSVRHERAKIDGKLTAGEAAKYLTKELSVKILAKELVEAYKILEGKEPEWHHAGFYKNSKKKSTMGRTFFFTDSDIQLMIEKWDKLAEKKAAIMAEETRKRETIIWGFYYSWDHDYSGYRGKKRNFKVLGWYEGSEASKPANFTSCTKEFYDAHKGVKRTYTGWDEPRISDFQ